MRRVWLTMAGLCAAFGLTLSAIHAQIPSRSSQIQHAKGQNVAPVYEGWYNAPDGTTRVSFGYLNRNYEEALDIPAGPSNKIEPGPADQGQPTHFLPRRQYGVFVLTLPKDRPKTELTWSLSVAGQTESVPATLNDLYAIDALKRIGGASDGSTPPVMKFSAAGPSAAGPAGVTTTLKASETSPVTLDVWVADQSSVAAPGATALPAMRPALPVPRSPLRVTWSKYRGPGAVHFSNLDPLVEQGKASTTATFAEAGEYVLRAVASRGSGFGGQCCWTNGYATVVVGPAGQGR